MAIAAAATGCLSKPGPPAGTISDGGERDGPTEAAMPCVMPALSDSFQGTTLCAPWGTLECNGATCTEGNGLLVFTPKPNMMTVGLCGGNVLVGLTDAGVFVEVASVVAGPSAATKLSVDGASGFQFSLYTDGVCLIATELNSAQSAAMPYDASTMRWWRVRPGPQSDVLVEVSPDGKMWRVLETLGVAPPPQVLVTLGVTVAPPGLPSPGPATFKNLDVCPP